MPAGGWARTTWRMAPAPSAAYEPAPENIGCGVHVEFKRTEQAHVNRSFASLSRTIQIDLFCDCELVLVMG